MAKSKTAIDVRFKKKIPGISTAWVQHVIAKAHGRALRRCPVNVYLTDNKEIRKINKQFLKHDYATDVISFSLGDSNDLVVSFEMARQMAKELKIPFREELARYLVHGTLHLLGYDDKKKSDHARMHARQEAILKKI